MTPETRILVRKAYRAEAREAAALRAYRFWRSRWYGSGDRRLFLRAFIARTAWNALRLEEPTEVAA